MLPLRDLRQAPGEEFEEGGPGLEDDEPILRSKSSLPAALALPAIVSGGSFAELGDGYLASLLPAISSALHLAPTSLFVELSGDTGVAQALAEAAHLREPVIVVGGSDVTTAAAPAAGAPRRVLRRHATALDFTKEIVPAVHYDAALLHQIVHNLSSVELGDVFTGVHRQLTPQGRLVVVARPPEPGGVPLFPAAAEAWRVCTPDPGSLAAMLRDAGFEVAPRTLDVPVRLPRPAYLELIASRYFPCLATLADNVLADGVEELRQQLAVAAASSSAAAQGRSGGGADEVSFTDRLVLLVAVKPAA
jgi:hypothetical protein